MDVDVGLEVTGEVDGVDLVGAFVVGDLVGWIEDGAEVTGKEGASVVLITVAPVLTIVEEVVDEGLEQPAVRLTSCKTVSDHEPPTSCCATQKKAPPLHPNSPALYDLSSEST